MIDMENTSLCIFSILTLYYITKHVILIIYFNKYFQFCTLSYTWLPAGGGGGAKGQFSPWPQACAPPLPKKSMTEAKIIVISLALNK